MATATQAPPTPPTAPPTPQSGAVPPGGTAQSKQAAAATAATAVRQGAVASWIEGLGSEADDPTGGAPPTAVPPTPPASTSTAPAPAPAAPAPTAAAPSDGAAKPGTAPAEGAAGPDPDKWPRSAKEWDNFKKVRDENYRKRDEQIAALSRDLKAREERLASLQAAQTIDPAEHTAIKEERDKLSEALRLAAVEKHPRFQAYYDNKVNAQVDLAKRVVGPEHAESVTAILKLPDGEWRNARLEELMSNLSPAAQSRLGAIVNSVDSLQSERISEIERARADFESLQKRQQSEAQAQAQARKAQAEADFASALADAQANGFAMLQPKPATDADAAAWNAAVNERVQAAKSLLFGQLPPGELARAALAAASFPALLQSHSALQAELAALQAQLAALRSATPTVQRGAPSPDGAPQRPRPSAVGSRPMQAAADWLALVNQGSEP